MTSPGTVLTSRYRLTDLISRTTASEVWRAHDGMLDRAVAVKVLLGGASLEAMTVRAAALATVNHPGVAAVYDSGAEPGVGPYVVMELVEGTTLDATLTATRTLTGRRTVEVLAETADALAAVHARAVVHARLTPRRILVRPNGSIVLVGFDLSGAPGLPGGPYPADYVSPEQAMGGAPAPVSDVYSLGVIAFRCLTGDLPFTSLDPAAQAMHHARDVPPPLPSVVDPGLRDLVTRAMAKPPSQRPTAAQLADEARRLGAPPPTQQYAGPPERAARGAPPPTPAPAPASPGGPLPQSGAPPEPGGPPPMLGGLPDDADRARPDVWGGAQPGYAGPGPTPVKPRGPAPRSARGIPWPSRDAAPEPTVPALEPAASGIDERLEFAAAYRRIIEQSRPYPLVFFVHRPAARALVQELIGRRAAQLGGTPMVSRGEAAQEVRSGTTLTIVPNVIGAVFEPRQIDVVVGDEVRELTFQMAVPPDALLGPLDGYIDIFVGPLVVGQVPVTFDVRPAGAPPVPKPADGTELLTVANASIFDKIFISYSRRDSQVVDLCVLTYQGLGVRVLVDRIDLRSGDDWRAGLERMIREADIFQLYWSAASAASAEVHHEWGLALELSKTRDRFIRPLYWELPMPPTPEALGHLHFSRLDLKRLRHAAKAYAPSKPGLFRRVAGALGLKDT